MKKRMILHPNPNENQSNNPSNHHSAKPNNQNEKGSYLMMMKKNLNSNPRRKLKSRSLFLSLLPPK